MTKSNQTPNEIHTQIQYRLIEKLEASERRYRLMLESLQEIVFTVDHSGIITFLNSAWNKVLGYSLTESLNKPITQFIEPQQLEVSNQLFDSIFKNKEKIRTELNFKHEQGQNIWLELSANPTPDGGITGTLTDITQRKQAVAKLEYAAFHDSLTGLYNRSGLTAYLAQELTDSRQDQTYGFALLFLDLDGFKLVNDSFGHLFGDNLLVEVSKRLRKCLRPQDILARFGGDEFVILLTGVTSLEDTIRISERIQPILKPAFKLDGQEAFIETSIGIVLDNGNYLNTSDILRNGDIALYKAKERGKGCFVVFDDTMLVEIKERMQLETYLRQSIGSKEFKVYYQPIIDSDNFQILGFEALLRWKHSKLGMIPPAKFIPIAEETGLIVDLGRYVLQEACQQLSKWHQLFTASQSCFISVNLSAKQFSRTSLIREVKEVLKVTQLSPQSLKLEITESIMMNNAEINIAKIRELNNLGVQFCIDDFGTGYSSLSYLYRFPIDVLKIDRSFINSINISKESQDIVEAIIVLAHKLGLKVIAEGVETEEQLTQLKSYNCEQIQGYLFFPPLPANSIEELLDKFRPLNTQEEHLKHQNCFT